MRATLAVAVLIGMSLCAGACHDEGTVEVHSLSFKGVKAVD